MMQILFGNSMAIQSIYNESHPSKERENPFCETLLLKMFFRAGSKKYSGGSIPLASRMETLSSPTVLNHNTGNILMKMIKKISATTLVSLLSLAATSSAYAGCFYGW